MNFARGYRKAKRNVRNRLGRLLIRWGIAKPFGKCPRCGRALRFDGKAATISCPRCGVVAPP